MLLSAAIAGAGCSGTDPGNDPTDAAPGRDAPGDATPDGMPPTRHVVRGLATGVLEPVELQLAHAGGSETLSITGDGPFAFEAQLAAGDSYDVTFVGAPPCVLESGSGTIASEDPEVVVACAGAAVLTDIVISGPTAPALDVSLAEREYTAEVSLLQQSMTITAVALRPESTITIAGLPVASGTPSQELALALGANEVEIAVSHPSGRQQTYRVTVQRAAALAQHAYGKASNTGANDAFGDANSMALAGDILVVGARQEDSGAAGVGGDQNDDSVTDSGAVYVFRRTGTSWVQEAYLKASNPGAGDIFGISVALAGDTLAVGAHGEDSAATGVDGDQDDNSATDSGAVYVFRRTGTSWAQEAYLKASNTGAGDRFGIGVALAGDTLAVGAPREDSAATGVDGDQDDNSATDSGAVYVFRRTGTSWAQEAYLKASNPGANDVFGLRLALAGDTLAVTAIGEASAATGVNGDQDDNDAPGSGAAYVFRRTGTSWAQEAYIKASNTGENDTLGQSVALAGDTLAVGAWWEASGATGVNGDQDDNSAFQSGAVYVYRRSGTNWAQEAYLKASNTRPAHGFGDRVALSGDTLAVGACCESSAATGVGGNQNDNSTFQSGAIYVFQRSSTGWVQQAYVKASNTGEGDQFGRGLALAGDTLAVGAGGEDSAATGMGGNQDDDSASGSGAIYVFH